MTLSQTQISKFVYVGQGGPLSIIPLLLLCESGHYPSAVIIADKCASPRGLNLLPVRPPKSVDSLASVADEHGLPLIRWQKGCEDEITAKLMEIEPDLVIMSCFPWRITEALLSIPAQGWWNLHPSLLPRYRGPTPLFWQVRAGEEQTGVSLHQVVAEMDAGAILGQQTVSLSAFQGRELEEEIAKQGAKLIEHALFELAQGKLLPKRQSKAESRYDGFPTHQNRCLEINGAASKAYRFIVLVNAAYPLWLDANNKRYHVKEAISFDDDKKMNKPFLIENNQLTIQFEQGILTILVEEA